MSAISSIIELFEGTNEPIEGFIVDETGAPVALDSTYVTEFQVVRELTNEVLMYKSSTQSAQILYDADQTANKGKYQTLRTLADTIGKAGRHVYTLTVKKNNSIFHVKQGVLLIKGVNVP